jgi:hypothetical protein
MHLATIIEVLQSIKQSDMSPMLERIYKSEGGIEILDVLMKYLYESFLLYPTRCFFFSNNMLTSYCLLATKEWHIHLKYQPHPEEQYLHRPPAFHKFTHVEVVKVVEQQ